MLLNCFFIFLTVFLSFFLFYLSYFALIKKSISSDQKFNQKSFSKPFYDIKKANYTRTENGNHTFHVQADRIKVEKAKLGIFRFALMKQVIFDNARIKIIQTDNKNIDTMMPLTDTDILPDSLSKQKANIIFKPVEVQILSKTGKVLIKITAESAGFNKKNRLVNFQGSVKIKSQSATLFTPTLTIITKSGKAVAHGGYHLITPVKSLKGNKLLTNIFLSTFNDIAKGET